MKTLRYSIRIDKPRDFVFNKIMDKSAYPDWQKAWSPGMRYEGDWQEGTHISFFDDDQGGTKVLVEEIKPYELIRTKHVAMVNLQNIEIEPTDDAAKKWVGSQENYHFKEISENQTNLEVEMIVDETFQQMFDETWPKALHYFKEICEK